jgi:hypothetical protein
MKSSKVGWSVSVVVSVLWFLFPEYCAKKATEWENHETEQGEAMEAYTELLKRQYGVNQSPVTIEDWLDRASAYMKDARGYSEEEHF